MTCVLKYVLQGKGDQMTKIVPTTEKVTIKWIVWHGREKEYRSNEVKWGQGYDFECSCGYESRTGGAILSAIQKQIWQHKFYEHDYDIDKNAMEKRAEKRSQAIAELKEKVEKLGNEIYELGARLERESE